MTPPSPFYREIPLTQGQVAIVSSEDYEIVSQWKWSASRAWNGYYAVRGQWINGKHTLILMHRQILGLMPGDKRIADHINGNKLDNRRENLRIATPLENSRNSGLFKTNKLGVKGVRQRGRRFSARIKSEERQIHLGYFSTSEEAHAAYQAAGIKYFGEFFRQ